MGAIDKAGYSTYDKEQRDGRGSGRHGKITGLGECLYQHRMVIKTETRTERHDDEESNDYFPPCVHAAPVLLAIW